MTTREQLYAAVVAEPGDDTVRLAYADFLDEQGDRVPCPRCHGTGSHAVGRAELDLRFGSRGAARVAEAAECGVCRGTGIDTSDADRAEFIRAQIELEKCRPDCGVGRVCRGVPETFRPSMTCAGVRLRAVELLQKHPEWARCPCPACRGRGGRTAKTDGGYDDEWIPCGTCGGTGDLLRVDRRYEDITLTETSCQRAHQFARGFVDSVTLTHPEALVYYRSLTPEPTPLLLALVRSLPLTRVYLSDAVIYPSGGNDTYYVGGLGVFPDKYRHELGGHPTTREAREALARVICRFARERAVTRA